ncbi:MAG: ribokinase [Blautia sp.]|nr:ribokinase [Blautia sp.]
MKILNFGSLNLDYVYDVDHMVQEGETLASAGMKVMMGGKGLNQSIALAKASLPVFHAGQVGAEGGDLTACLAENGVDTRFVRVVEGRSGHTIIQVDKEGRNCILLYGGANRSLTEDYIQEVLDFFEEGDILVLQNEVNLLGFIVDEAYKRGLRIVLNPSPYDAFLEKVDFSKIGTLFLNEVEGEQLSGVSDAEGILAALKERFPNTEVILTLGTKGSVYQKGEERYFQDIFPVKAVDTTAAGDTFTGFFLSAREKGYGVQEALKLASKASSVAVTRPGAAASIPTWSEVVGE